MQSKLDRCNASDRWTRAGGADVRREVCGHEDHVRDGDRWTAKIDGREQYGTAIDRR